MMKTRLTKKIVYFYSLFIFIIFIFSVAIYLKINDINKIFDHSVLEYELVIKLNQVKTKYYENSVFKVKSEEEYAELNQDLQNIRDHVKRLELHKNTLYFLTNKFVINRSSPEKLYNFLNYSEKTLEDLHTLNIKRIEIIKSTLLIYIFLVIIFGIFMIYYFTRTITSPILRLKEAVAKIDDSYTIDEFKDIRTDDEIELLAREFEILVNKVRESEKILTDNNDKLESLLKEKIDEINRINKRVFHHKKLSALGKLVAGIAHEIKNPLNVMINIIPEIKTEDKETIGILNHQIRRINDLVSGFLDYARYEKYDIKSIDIVESIENVLNFFKKANPDININFEKNVETFFIETDVDKIEAAFLNLLINARESFDKKENNILIYIDGKSNELKIKVRDNGSGIDENIIDKIFDPFFSTKEKGNGLGLAIVYNIIKFSGGEIIVNSKKDEGTEFLIIFEVEHERKNINT